MTVYVPMKGVSGLPIGAYEVYLATDRLDGVVARGTRKLLLTVLAVFAALYAALALLVRCASTRLRSQAHALEARSAELLESYALLEQSSLETIETLNPRARAVGPDPMRAPELKLLGAAALFHDVGKIGVPDGILTKPAALTREEAVVKQVTRLPVLRQVPPVEATG